MANFTIDAAICIERKILLDHDQQNQQQNIISDFNIVETCKWLSDNHFTKVCLQFPDELINVSARIYEEIKNQINIDLYILGDTSYASCCVDSVAAMHVQGEAIIHYGRSCFSKTNIPVFTVLPKRTLNVTTAMEALHNSFNSDNNIRLCLFYDPDYEHCKDVLSTYWYQQYPHSYIAFIQIEDTENSFSGRILKNKNGEDMSVAILRDCYCIYVGSRNQTLFNYTISIAALNWYVLNPKSTKLEKLDETTWFKRRRFLIEKCKDANVVGILVCQLAGNLTMDIISRMKQLCRVNGKKSYIVSVGKPNVAKLANFSEIDIYVMIACPENDLYNNRDFYKPIVYPFELEVALNANREQYFTNHITDYDEMLPGRRHFCEIDGIKGTDVSLITGKIRETKIDISEGTTSDLTTRQSWALENIGQNLQDRSWKGLEQRLGETEVKKVEVGRKGIPLEYSHEHE